ncbi:MAG: phosphotransferase [Oscillospiraceae bacterium]
MSSRETPAQLTELVKKNLAPLYGIRGNFTVALTRSGVNHIFTVTVARSKRVLKLSAPDYYTREETEAEALWMANLRKSTPLILPKVIAGVNGAYVQTILNPETGTTYNAMMYTYLQGDADKALHGNDLLKKMIGVGRISATLHNFSARATERISRITWDFNTLLGDAPFWGDWRRFPGMKPDQRTRIESAIVLIRKRLAAYGRGFDRFGLVHTDLQFGNIVIRGTSLQVVDFDDCGYGWFLYDLGGSLCGFDEELDTLADAWLTGYRDVRNLSPADYAEIPTFILMRRIVRLAAVASGAPSGNSAHFVPERFLSMTADLCADFLAANAGIVTTEVS